MSRLEETKKTYQNAVEKLHTDKEYFTNWLRYSGRFYKIPATHTMALFESNPKATIFADYDNWKKYGNSVKFQERSSAALVENGSKLKHYFDISQTTAVNLPFQWGIDKDITEEFLKDEARINCRGFRNMATYINTVAINHISDNAEEILSKFPVNEADRKAFLYSVSTMVMTVIAARCEYKSTYKYKTPDIPDLSALDMLKTNEDTVKLCNTVQQSAKAILLKMEKSITQIINIRTEALKNERNRNDEADRGMEQQVPQQQGGIAGASARGRETGNDLVRGSAGMVSDVHNGGKGHGDDSIQAEQGTEFHVQSGVLGRDRGGNGDNRVLRQEMAGVYGAELSRHGTDNEYQQLGLGDGGEEGGYRSGGDVSDFGRTVSESKSPSHNVYGDSQVGENEAVGDRSRGNGDGGASISGELKVNTENTAEASKEASAVLRDTYSTLNAVRLGDFYELFGDEAKIAAEKLGLTLTSRNGEPMAGFPQHVLNEYKAKLEKQGFSLTVEENPDLGKISKRDTYSTNLQELIDQCNNGLEKIYVDKENEIVTHVYYNPDSSAGGQLVYNYFSIDELFEAQTKEEPIKHLETFCRQEVVDIDRSDFAVKARDFLENNEDFNSKDDNFYEKLSAITEPSFSIIQLKDNENLRDYHFASMSELREKGLYVDKGNYRRTYRGRLKGNETLDDIFTRFNIDRPKDFEGHSLSVGDIIGIVKDGKPTAYFVDSVGYKEIPDFLLEKSERIARRLLTDDIPSFAEKQLASDEMDDLGDKLFNYENTPHYNNEKWFIGNGMMTAEQFEDITTRYHNGEDVRKELAKGLYGNLKGEQEIWIDKNSLRVDTIKFSISNSENGLTFNTKGGFEIYYTWEQLGEAMITAAKREFDRHEKFDREYAINEFRKRTEAQFNKIDEHSSSELEELVKEQINAIFSDNGIEAEVGETILIGSRSRGLETEKSDLDFVVEVKSDLKEDALFNILNENPYEIGGIKVDINPIRQEESGKIADYLENAEYYLLKKKKAIFEGLRANTEKTAKDSKETSAVLRDTDTTLKVDVGKVNNAFEKLKEKHIFSPEADEFLGRVKNQIIINNYDSFNLKNLTIPLFQQKYGNIERINEVLFKGELEAVINEINAYIKGETLGKEAEINTDGNQWFVTDKKDGNTILYEKEDFFSKETQTYKEYLKSVAENNPDYAEYINSHIPKLLKDIDDIEDSLASEYREAEYEKLAVELGAGGGYGEDMANAAAEKRLEQLKELIDNKEYNAKLTQSSFIEIATDLLSVNETVANAHKNATEQEYRLEVTKGIEQIFTEAVSGTRDIGYSTAEISPLYNSFQSQKDIRDYIENIVTENVDIALNAEEKRIENIRQFAKEQDIPFSEKYDDGAEDFDPYAADGSMSFEDFRKQQKLYIEDFGNNEQTQDIGLKADVGKLHNFTITEPNFGTGGLKTKCAANIAAIKTLKQIEAENRNATPEEQEILSKYVGWGGMAQEVFSGKNEKWIKEHTELKELLTDEEYAAAQGSTLNAHYTTPTVINAIYKALDNMGFKKGKVLEPSMGVGNFFGCIPEKMKDSELCLWLKNLPPLIATNNIGKPDVDTYIRQNGKPHYKCWTQQLSSAKERSKTFPCIAQAMAKQWCGNEDRKVKYFQSWSGGKDSTASIILEHIYGLPPSKIIMSEVMFDRKRNISGELPEHMEWVHGTAIPLFRSWGYEVEIVRAERDYLDLFFHIRKKSRVEERNGKYVGFVMGGRCEANKLLKIKAISDFYKSVVDEFIQFVGIAADEPERLKRLNGTNKVSLLAKYGYTKQLDYNLCKKFGLLSPVYDFSNRGGCWFCPSASIKEYAHTKSEYPELWEELRKLSLTDNLVSYGFKYGETFAEIDRKVEAYLNAR